MPGSKTHLWKILAMGRGKSTAAKAEEHLHSLGYPNVKVIGVENDKINDDEVLELLKGNNWDAVCFGGGLTGYDENFPKETTTLHWFNRVVNMVHENAPKAKFIFVTSPNDLVDSFERVLGSIEKKPETT